MAGKEESITLANQEYVEKKKQMTERVLKPNATAISILKLAERSGTV